MTKKYEFIIGDSPSTVVSRVPRVHTERAVSELDFYHALYRTNKVLAPLIKRMLTGEIITSGDHYFLIKITGLQ